MAISATQVKELREKSGAGIMDCKRALEETDGDVERAINLLKQQGLAKADKKAGRAAQEGVVEPYIHGAGRIGSLVEVNCETDFVARTDDFKALAHDLAMQVAATAPKYLSADEVPEADFAQLEEEYGSRDKALAALSLMDQPFIKDGKVTIRDLIRESIGKLGENIQVRRFARFEVGADLPADDESAS